MVTSAVAGAFLLVRVTSTESLFGFSLDGVGTGNKGNSTRNFAQHFDIKILIYYFLFSYFKWFKASTEDR